MTTLDVVPKKKAEPSAEETAAKELVRAAREQGLSLTGLDGLLEQFWLQQGRAWASESEADPLAERLDSARWSSWWLSSVQV